MHPFILYSQRYNFFVIFLAWYCSIEVWFPLMLQKIKYGPAVSVCGKKCMTTAYSVQNACSVTDKSGSKASMGKTKSFIIIFSHVQAPPGQSRTRKHIRPCSELSWHCNRRGPQYYWMPSGLKCCFRERPREGEMIFQRSDNTVLWSQRAFSRGTVDFS